MNTPYETANWNGIARRMMRAASHFRHAHHEIETMILTDDGTDTTLPEGRRLDGTDEPDGRDNVLEEQLRGHLLKASEMIDSLTRNCQVNADDLAMEKGQPMCGYLDGPMSTPAPADAPADNDITTLEGRHAEAAALLAMHWEVVQRLHRIDHPNARSAIADQDDFESHLETLLLSTFELAHEASIEGRYPMPADTAGAKEVA